MSEPDYKDDTGKSVQLSTLCRMNPEWAASHIRNTRDEIERLKAEVRVLRDHMRTCDEDAADIELGNLIPDSGKQTIQECLAEEIEEVRADMDCADSRRGPNPWDHDPSCPEFKLKDGTCTCAEKGQADA